MAEVRRRIPRRADPRPRTAPAAHPAGPSDLLSVLV